MATEALSCDATKRADGPPSKLGLTSKVMQYGLLCSIPEPIISGKEKKKCPNTDHTTCIASLLGRANQIDDSVGIQSGTRCTHSSMTTSFR